MTLDARFGHGQWIAEDGRALTGFTPRDLGEEPVAPDASAPRESAQR